MQDGDVLLGGFGMTGNPVHLLHALAETGTKDLTFIRNNVGESNLGGGRLLRNGQLKKMIGSFFTSNPDAARAAQSGQVAYELLPQGTLVEALRAGGFYTPTSAGTVLAEGRPTMVIMGQEQVFVKGIWGNVALVRAITSGISINVATSIRGNVALVRAWRADTAVNLCYRLTDQNFNRAMATAADLVVAEVEESVPVGELYPNHIHTLGCFVDYLVQAHVTAADLGTSASSGGGRALVWPSCI